MKSVSVYDTVFLLLNSKDAVTFHTMPAWHINSMGNAIRQIAIFFFLIVVMLSK
jgi:hypothetical protein